MSLIQSSDNHIAGKGMLPGSGSRMSYIDFMRGFSMLLVVFAHVLLKMDAGGDRTVVGAMALAFRMPLFFFTSGMFAFRPAMQWTLPKIKSTMAVKICAQIGGAAIFYILYQLSCGKYISNFITKGPQAYWFTIVLFQMFTAYLVLTLVGRRLRLSLLAEITLLAGGLTYYILTQTITITIPRAGIWLEWEKTLYYLPYFVSGLLARRYYEGCHQIVEKQWFRIIVIVLFIGLFTLRYNNQLYHYIKNYPHFTWILYQIMRLSGLCMVYMIFYTSRSFFDRPLFLNRIMLLTGRRTLQVYYLHYFFVPALPWAAGLAKASFNTVPILVVAGLTAVIVTALSLGIGAILCKSRILAYFLFGIKKKLRD